MNSNLATPDDHIPRLGAPTCAIGRAFIVLIVIGFIPLVIGRIAKADSGSAEDSGRPLLRVATINVAHGRGSATAQIGLGASVFHANVSRIAVTISAHEPDIVALQEADAPSAWSGGFDHVRRIADLAEYPHVHHGVHFDVGVGTMRIAYGTALLSRQVLTKRESHPFKSGPLHRKGYVAGELEFDGRPLTLISLHLHSGSRDVRAKQARELIEQLDEYSNSMSMIVMGDFNGIWSEKDDALRIIAHDLGLIAYDAASANRATFRSASPHTRLDWILISKDLEFVSYDNWHEQISDHLAVQATVRRKSEK